MEIASSTPAVIVPTEAELDSAVQVLLLQQMENACRMVVCVSRRKHFLVYVVSEEGTLGFVEQVFSVARLGRERKYHA